MLSVSSNPLDRNGLVSLDGFQDSEWVRIFSLLDEEQQQFLANESFFRSSEYKWPRRPLQQWSRAWEYPYVFHQILQWQKSSKEHASSTIVDVGSGVTFFPFLLARHGCNVICTDIDEICQRDLQKAIKVVPHDPGRVEFRLSSEKLPFEENEVSLVYCISVLEHIPAFEDTVKEISRILKPGGLFILSIDLDLKGNSSIGVNRYHDLKSELDKHFAPAHPLYHIHPAELLTSRRGPFPLEIPSGPDRLWFEFKQLLKPLIGRSRAALWDVHLAVEAMTLINQKNA